MHGTRQLRRRGQAQQAGADAPPPPDDAGGYTGRPTTQYTQQPARLRPSPTATSAEHDDQGVPTAPHRRAIPPTPRATRQVGHAPPVAASGCSGRWNNAKGWSDRGSAVVGAYRSGPRGQPAPTPRPPLTCAQRGGRAAASAVGTPPVTQPHPHPHPPVGRRNPLCPPLPVSQPGPDGRAGDGAVARGGPSPSPPPPSASIGGRRQRNKHRRGTSTTCAVSSSPALPPSPPTHTSSPPKPASPNTPPLLPQPTAHRASSTPPPLPPPNRFRVQECYGRSAPACKKFPHPRRQEGRGGGGGAVKEKHEGGGASRVPSAAAAT